MAQPITTEQALRNLPPSVELIFKRICDQYVQTNENIYHAAYCTVTDQRWSKELDAWTTNQVAGVFTITDYRIIFGTFVYGIRDTVTFAKGDRTKTYEWFFGRNRTWQWILPPLASDMPDVYKLGREKWGRKINENIREMPLFYQDKIAHKEYHVEHNGDPIDLFLLKGVVHDKGEDDWFDVAFLYEDGKKVYELLQEALRNRGRLNSLHGSQSSISSPPSPIDPVEALSMLKRMLEQGLISELEYQAKKSEILSKI